jgi:hypothetical protein
VAVDTLRAFDGQLSGKLEFGQGKAQNAYVQNWKQAADSVRWPVRLREPATFEVAIAYDAPKSAAGGSFTVKLGEQSLTGQVAESSGAPVSLGRVTLPAGNLEITVQGTKLQGDELMRLRALTLTPTTGAVSSLRAGP